MIYKGIFIKKGHKRKMYKNMESSICKTIKKFIKKN